MKIVIVGGVAGGASAAARARRLSEDAQIIVFERGAYVSFANCGLPYHIGGEILQRESLLVQTVESLQQRFNLDVRIYSEVLGIDREGKKIKVRHIQTGEEYEETYDQLLLSPGAAPLRPPLLGLDDSRVFTLRSLPDMDAIIQALAQKPSHVTVVGGGFIGLEMVEALRHRDLAVTLLELSPQVMAPIDPEMAAIAHEKLQQQKVDLRLRTGLQAIDAKPEALYLQLGSGDCLKTEMLILAIGVKPETQLAKQAGLALGEKGGIAVDAYLRTSDACIYAVGDAIETPDFTTGLHGVVPLAGPANRQGRIAADNMLGRQVAYQKTQGTAICKLFDLAIGSTGLNEKTLKTLQRPYEKVYVHTASHASYYPDAQPVTLKLLFNPDDGTLYGAQAVGRDGVDKRIDVLAVAQRAGLKVQDLEHLELSYAPPFGSARDVVNQAGMLAHNVMRGDECICHAQDAMQPTPTQKILDVRTEQERQLWGRFPDAVCIPLDELRQRMGELSLDKEWLIACQAGVRGHVAYRLLSQAGYRAKNLSGGFKMYHYVRKM